MEVYRSKYSMLAGTSYSEAVRAARLEYKKVQPRTKRQPYVRSKYFNNEKVFINMFFNHLVQKRKGEQIVRAKLFLVGIDLLRHNETPSDNVLDAQQRNIILHRFYGITKDGKSFCVQVKENKRTDRKDFMSVFPRKINK